MAAKLLTSDEIEAFVHAWLQRWGEQRTNKSGLQYWRLDNGDHLVNAFKELISTLKEQNGYEVKDFRQVKVEILHIMRPIEAAKDKKTAERWRAITIGLWNIAIGAKGDVTKHAAELCAFSTVLLTDDEKRTFKIIGCHRLTRAVFGCRAAG